MFVNILCKQREFKPKTNTIYSVIAYIGIKSKKRKLDKEETAMPPDWDSKTLQGFLYSQDLSNCTTAIQFIDLLSL